MNFGDYPNFSKWEFDCTHTGKNEMRPEFLHLLQKIRDEYGKPMIITSGYRDPTHPIEATKVRPGAHAYGVACDIGVGGTNAQHLVAVAYQFGVRRIGVKQKASSRFIHIDIADQLLDFPPAFWTYT